MSHRKRSPIKPKGTVPGPKSKVADRVVWLLHGIWDGNSSEMARQIGCTHSALTKIAAGTQGPGRRLLTKIAEHPKVNPTWLFSGAGEPLLAGDRTVGEGVTLPIAMQPLTGAPEHYRDRLSGQTFPVAAAFHRNSRYWLHLERGARIVRDSEMSSEVGDLLLIETAPEWCQQSTQVDGRVCVIRPTDKELAPELARVRFIVEPPNGPEYWEANPFEVPPAIASVTRQYLFEVPSSGEPRIRSVTPRVTLKSQAGRAPRSQAREPYLVQLKQIIGVCVLMIRPHP